MNLSFSSALIKILTANPTSRKWQVNLSTFPPFEIIQNDTTQLMIVIEKLINEWRFFNSCDAFSQNNSKGGVPIGSNSISLQSPTQPSDNPTELPPDRPNEMPKQPDVFPNEQPPTNPSESPIDLPPEVPVREPSYQP